jgi:peptidyl-prolyl cis-trans isomerase SurA
MVPEFIVKTRTLQNPGDYSQPFETVFGWHIIRLIERKPVGTFEEEKTGLETRLAKDKRMSLSEESIIRQIKQEYGFKEYPKAKAQLLSAIDTTILAGTWKADTVAGLTKTLVSIGNKKYTQYDFAKYLGEKQKKQAPTVEIYFNDNYKKFVNEICLAYEDSKLEEKYPDFKRLVTEYHDGILLFDLTDKKVWSKAVKDTTGLKEFYEAHKNRYVWGPRMEATIFTITGDSKLNVEDVRKEAGLTTDTEKILNTFNTDTVAYLKAESGIFSKGDNEIIDKIEWKTGVSEVVNSKKGPAFASVVGLLGPMPKTLDEARGLITADYQAYLEEEWIKELRAKYPVVIHEEVLNQLK